MKKGIAKDDFELNPHSWTKGLDYEIVEKTNFFTIASNEGQVNFVNKIKSEFFENFQIVIA